MCADLPRLMQGACRRLDSAACKRPSRRIRSLESANIWSLIRSAAALNLVDGKAEKMHPAICRYLENSVPRTRGIFERWIRRRGRNAFGGRAGNQASILDPGGRQGR